MVCKPGNAGNQGKPGGASVAALRGTSQVRARRQEKTETMPISKNSLLDHFKLLQQALERNDIEAILNVRDFTVCLRKGRDHRILYPQFLVSVKEVRQYLPAPSPAAEMFAGWLPYRNKRWTIASDKLAFKRFAVAAGLPTPAFSDQPSVPLSDAIIKQVASSFGTGILGPFRSGDAPPINGDRSQYLERFVPGTIVKLWYWDAMPVCMEMDDMPFVKGDGLSSIDKLLSRRLAQKAALSPADRKALREQVENVLRYFGLTLASVLAPDQIQLLDFRYGSTLIRQDRRIVVDLQANPQQFPLHLLPLLPLLGEVGDILHAAIPAELRAGTLFTTDCILDRENRLWLLEFNSNPTVHPHAYPLMISSMFARDGRPSR